MKEKRRRYIAILLAAVITVTPGCAKRTVLHDTAVTGAGTGSETALCDTAVTGARAGSGTGVEFTDSTGRTFCFTDKIAKVAVTGPLSQIVFYAFAPELLIGWCEDWSEEASAFIPDEYTSLPVLGQLYGSKGGLNLEELLAADPDVVVDIGEPKENVREDMESLGTQTGIPFVHIDATLSEMGNAFRMLGELTGLEERADEYALYCESVYSRAVDIMTDVGDNRYDAIYCLGDSGLNVIARGSYFAEVIDLTLNNVAVVEAPSSKGSGNEVDIEQIFNWDPDIIIFAPDSIYDTVSSDEVWQEVSAVRTKCYLKVPGQPYNWMGFPPSVQRLLALIWLPYALYPDHCDYDLKTEVTEYYKMFYHCDLTDEQYKALVEGAVPIRK